jgi:hypothetical protein
MPTSGKVSVLEVMTRTRSSPIHCRSRTLDSLTLAPPIDRSFTRSMTARARVSPMTVMNAIFWPDGDSCISSREGRAP